MAECERATPCLPEPDMMSKVNNNNNNTIINKPKTQAAETPHKNRIDEDNRLWVPIAAINEHITCGICKGYLFDAATITECMHSFCKSCIIRHLERSLQCPTCQILIHPTDPYVHIRLDRLLQDIVDGLLPHLAEEELAREKKFYAENERSGSKLLPPPVLKSGVRVTHTAPVASNATAPYSFFRTQQLAPLLSLSLQCKCSSPLEKKLDKRYIRVTGEATVNNVVLFLRKKLVLTEDHMVGLFSSCSAGFVSLEPTCTLSSVKEEYFKQEEFLHLEYEVSPRKWLV